MTTVRVMGMHALMAAAAVAAHAEPPSSSTADRAAPFAVVGFAYEGGRWVRCDDDPPTASYTAGRLGVGGPGFEEVPPHRWDGTRDRRAD